MKELNLESIMNKDRLQSSAARTKGFVCNPKCGKVLTMKEYWKLYGNEIISEVLEGSYRLRPYRLFKRKKAGGKVRWLSVPQPQDMVLLRATAEALTDFSDDFFSPYSFGFRKGVSTKNAIERCIENIENGNTWFAKIDISKCFDEINIKTLISVLYKMPLSGNTMQWLMRIFATPPLMRTYFAEMKGIGQGSPLSPVMANIYLNELDLYLEGKHIEFIRYADDIVLFSKSRKALIRYYESVEQFLKSELNLRINKGKTIITSTGPIEILGYVIEYVAGNVNVKAPNDSIIKLKERALRLSKEPYIDNVEKLNRIGAANRGWINYFKFTNLKSVRNLLMEFDEDEITQLIPLLNPSEKEMIESYFISCLDWYESLGHRP